MTSIMRKRLLVVAAATVLVALLAVTMQAVLAADGTFVTKGGEIDGEWPWQSAFGTTPVGSPSDSYHASVNHWNPASNGSISMDVKDGSGETMGFKMTAWSASANVVNGSSGSWTWDSDNPSHAPAAYPDFFQGCHWGQCTWDGSDWGSGNAGMPYPIQVNKIKNLKSTYEISVDGNAAESGAVWNAAFDIWLDKGERTIQNDWWHTVRWPKGTTTQDEIYGDFEGWTIMPGFPGAYLKYVNQDGSENSAFKQIGQDDGAEIMIWMNNKGYNNDPITPAGKRVAEGVTVSDISGSWDVWAARLQAEGDSSYPAWNVISYVRTTVTTSMTDFDANRFIQDAKTRDCPTEVRGDPTSGNKCVADSWWLTSVQAGFEIWANGEGLEVTNFSVKPNTEVRVETGLTHDSMTRIHWDQKFLLRYKTDTCATGVTAKIADNNGNSKTYDLVKVVPGIAEDVEGSNTKDMWAVRAGPLAQYGIHNNDENPGGSTVTFTPKDCGSPESVDVYIDPSGVVVNTLGEPIEGAKVTLSYAPGAASTDPEPAAGAFTMVPNGSDIMSPENRDNPDYTDANGYYRWDVKDGWYKVKAEADGCTSAESAALPVSEGNPATDVNLVLDCGGTPPSGLVVQLNTTTDWGTGYCKTVTITNNNPTAVDWTVNFDVEGTIYDYWNFTYTRSGDTVTAQGVAWNNILQAGETSHSIGFCANRTGGGPTPVPPSGVTVTVTTQSDWNTGYCANVTVKNTGSTPADWKVTFPVVGTVNNMWNAIWSQSGNTITAEGVGWNNILQPGASTHSIGFCAAK